MLWGLDDQVLPLLWGLDDSATCLPLLFLLGAIDGWCRKFQSEIFWIFVPRSMIGMVDNEVFKKVV